MATGLLTSDIAEATYGSSVQTVTSNAATGPGTLAAAPAAAEAGDTIRFAGDMTITAPASLTTPPNWFTISIPLTVDAGGNTVVLDANRAGRHFLVDAGGDLTLLADGSGGGSLSLENGLGVNSDTGSAVAAGSIYLEKGGSLHTEGVQFLNNETSAAGPSRGAGAISVVRNATVSISESTFRNNHAGRDSAGDYGGAIDGANADALSISDTVFESN